MELTHVLARYAYALGRWQAAWRFAPPELRQAVALAQVSAAWDMFRRDAGPGDVGPAHAEPAASISLLSTEDPRRDGVLLWLADHGAPAIKHAASALVRASAATVRFDEDRQRLLEAARDALVVEPAGRGPIARALALEPEADPPALAALSPLAAAIDHLRGDPAFLESAGEESRLTLPGGTFSHYVPAAPGAAWALNLALLARAAAPSTPLACPGLFSRQLFRALEPEEIAARLVDGAAAALENDYALFERLAPELERGCGALSRMSRNARARDAWPMVIALGGISRSQLARVLGLSRAGADIQAHALANAGLVTLERAGRISWSRRRPPVIERGLSADDDILPSGFADFDASMAEIDQLLARTASPR